MMGTDRVGLLVAVERLLPVGDTGEQLVQPVPREGGVETAKLKRDSVGETAAVLKGKAARVGVTVTTGGETDGWFSSVGGVTLRVRLDGIVPKGILRMAIGSTESGLLAIRPFVL